MIRVLIFLAALALIAVGLIQLVNQPGMVTSSDPNIGKAVGFLLSDDQKKGVIGTTNIGVLVAMGVGAALYALLTFALRIDPGRQHSPSPTHPATGGERTQVGAAQGDGSTRTTT